MKIPGLRSSYEMVGGLVFFGRMLDKIRLNAECRLPTDYNRGFGFDGRTCRFLNIQYERLVARVLEGGTDTEILEWCFKTGRRPDDEEIFVWNAFMTKRGWRDDISQWLLDQKRARGFEHRDDIQTAFDFHAADESEPCITHASPHIEGGTRKRARQLPRLRCNECRPRSFD